MTTLEEKTSRIDPDLLWYDCAPVYRVPHPGVLFARNENEKKENEAVYLLSEAWGKVLLGKRRLGDGDDSISIVCYHRNLAELLPTIKKVAEVINSRSGKVDIFLDNLEVNREIIFAAKKISDKI